MKVLFNNGREVDVNYVTDRDSRYLVLVDNVSKIKYIPDTWSSVFTEHSVKSLLISYAILVGATSYKTKGTLRRVCHNDDFYGNYKPSYSVEGTDKCKKLLICY